MCTYKSVFVSALYETEIQQEFILALYSRDITFNILFWRFLRFLNTFLGIASLDAYN